MEHTTDEYINSREAASRLGITARTLDNWVAQGLLIPHRFKGKRGLFFKQLDVDQLQSMRDAKTDLWSVKALALQALATARVTEQRLLQVFDHLGLNATPLLRDEDGVRYLYEYAQEALTPAKVLNAAWVRFWAGSFFMMDEVYFDLAAMHCRDPEPWRKYLDFANSVTREAHNVAGYAPEALTMAYRHFEAGKRHLWYIAYMTCRKTHGQRIADSVFGGTRNAVDEIMAVLH